MKKYKRTFLFILAAALTLSEILAAVGLAYAVREMRREALTYSQWYEGSLENVYRSVFLVLAVGGLMAGVWLSLFLKPRESPMTAKWRGCLRICFCVCAAAAVILVFSAGFIREQLLSARAKNQEGITYYIRTLGQCRILALIALDGAVGSLWALLRGKEITKKRDLSPK